MLNEYYHGQFSKKFNDKLNGKKIRLEGAMAKEIDGLIDDYRKDHYTKQDLIFSLRYINNSLEVVMEHTDAQENLIEYLKKKMGTKWKFIIEDIDGFEKLEECFDNQNSLIIKMNNIISGIQFNYLISETEDGAIFYPIKELKELREIKNILYNENLRSKELFKYTLNNLVNIE